MKKYIHKTVYWVVCILSSILLWSCGKDYANEKLAGPYKITKAEIAYYNNFSSTPDSVKTFENDTLGYFNLYNGTPAKIYIVVRYASTIFVTDYTATYYMHEKNNEILVVESSKALISYAKFTIDKPFKRKQQWSIIRTDYSGTEIMETIYVERI